MRPAFRIFGQAAYHLREVLLYPSDTGAQVVQQFYLPNLDGYRCLFVRQQVETFACEFLGLQGVGSDGTAADHVAEHFGVDALYARIAGTQKILEKTTEACLYGVCIHRVGPFECPCRAESHLCLVRAGELHGFVP